MTAYLATALVAAGLADQARQLLDRVAPTLSGPELEALASYLDAGRQRALAVRVFATAAAGRPVGATIAYMDVLRRHGQPSDAEKLLSMVVTARPQLGADLLSAFRAAGRGADAAQLMESLVAADPALCAAVASALWVAGADQDVERLVSGVAQRPLTDMAVAMTAFSAAMAGEGADTGNPAPVLANPFAARLLDRHAHEFVSAIGELRAVGHGFSADRLLEALCETNPDLVAGVALGLARSRLPQDAGTLLDLYGTRAAPDAVARVFMQLWNSGGDGTGVVATAALTGRTDSAAVLAAIRRAGGGDAADQHLAWLARAMPVENMIELCVSLSDQDGWTRSTRCSRTAPRATTLRTCARHCTTRAATPLRTTWPSVARSSPERDDRAESTVREKPGRQVKIWGQARPCRKAAGPRRRPGTLAALPDRPRTTPSEDDPAPRDGTHRTPRARRALRARLRARPKGTPKSTRSR
jgi:hypothetical protein